MPDPQFNIARKQLRESELSEFISGIFSQSFTGLANNFILNDQLAHLTGTETFNGQKSFSISPTVPYSGATGTAPSRLYVDYSGLQLQLQLNTLQNLMHISGTELVSGEKRFYKTIINSGTVTGQLNVPYPVSDSGAISLGYLNNQFIGITGSISGGAFVNLTSDQNVSGIKSFFGGTVYLPNATHPSGGVPLTQLDTTGTNIISRIIGTETSILSLQSQIDSLDLSAASEVVGFGGVLSLNAQSGNIFTQGRGTVTTVQNGNVLSISGHTLDGYTGCILGYARINSGVDRQFVGYGREFSVIPHVFTQLISLSGACGITSVVSGETNSGFNIVFNHQINSSGYLLNFIASTGTGALVNVVVGPAGERGISGANGLSVTGDNVNLGFYFNSVYTGNSLAESFVSKNFRVSGWAVGCVDFGTGSQVLTGNFYQRTTGNSKVNIVGFSLGTGAFFTGVYLNSLPMFSGLNRLGVDIIAKSTGISKLSLGLFGFGA